MKATVALALLLSAGAIPARAENLFLELLVPNNSTVGPPTTFSVTVNVRDADNGGQIVPFTRIPQPPRTLTVTASSAQGVLNVASVPLSSATITFSEAYSAAISITLSASVNLSPPGPGTTSGTSTQITFLPDALSQLVQIVPGETAAPGGRTPCKTGAPPQQTTNAFFSVQLRAEDQFCNVVNVNHPWDFLSNPAGKLTGQTSGSLANGLANFSVAISTDFCNLLVFGRDNVGGQFATSDQMTAQSNYYFQLDVPPSATVGPPGTFPVTLTLRNLVDNSVVPNTAICTPNPTVAISMLESGSPTSGTTQVTSVSLSQSSITFSEAQTRARTMQVRATCNGCLGQNITGNSVPFDLLPAAYSKVLLLMPWETARAEGNTTATGKTGAPPIYITQFASQAVNMRAVDLYWNIVSGAAGTARLDTVPAGFIGGASSLPWSGGLASFSVSVTTTGYNVGVRGDDSANAGIFSQAVSVNVFPPGISYQFTIPSPVVMTPQTFNLQAKLVDGGGSVVDFATHTVNLTVTQTTPAAGFSLGTTSGLLSSGILTIPTETVSRTGFFKVSASDVFGFTGTSSLNTANPEDHHYVVSVPTAVVFGAGFPFVVTRIDNGTGLPVARARTLTITGFNGDGSPLAAPESIGLTSANMTLGSQGYSQTFFYPNELITSASVYFLVQMSLDGDNLSPVSNLFTTSPVAQVQVGPPGGLGLVLTSPLLSAGGTCTVNATVRSTGEPHRVPGVPVNFSVILGTGTMVPVTVVGDGAGSSTSTLHSSTFPAAGYAVQAQFGVLVASVPVPFATLPVSSLSGFPLDVGTNGVLLAKDNTPFTLSAVSPVGVASIQYSVDGALPFTVYSSPFSLPPGAHTLKFFATDIFSQNEVAQTKTLYVSASGTPTLSVVSYPNPFNPAIEHATIEFVLPKAGNVRLRIFTQVGGLVLEKQFAAGAAGGSAGVNHFLWDGRNGDGHLVSNGVFFGVLDTADGRLTAKIAVRK